MNTRTLTSLILMPLVVLVTWYGYLPFFIFTLGLIIIIQLEFYKLASQAGFTPQAGVGIAGSILLATSIFISHRLVAYPWSGLILTLIIMCVIVSGVIKRDTRLFVSSASITLFGIFYVGWLLGHMVLLREIRPWGRSFTFLLFFITWMNDSVAYWIGSKYGKHKMSPHISPKKSWEGASAAVVASVLISIVTCATFPRLRELIWLEAPIFGLLLGVFGQLGDIGESLIKRNFHAKDSGNLLPGHGGMLDRFDSMIFNCAVLYYFVRIFVT